MEGEKRGPISVQTERRLTVFAVAFTIALTGLGVLYTLHVDDGYRKTWTWRQIHIRLQVFLLFCALLTYGMTYGIGPGDGDDWGRERPDRIYPSAGVAGKRGVGDEECGEIGTTNVVLERFCRPCGKAKMERVHHCSSCNKCILRFDHHCPWMGTCIGLQNGKFFLLFLLYTTVCSMHGAFVVSEFLLRAQQGVRQTSGNGEKIDARWVVSVAVICPVLLIVLLVTGLVVGAMFVWHVGLAARNETALEHMYGSGRGRGGYDCGTLANLRHVLGWNIVLWLVPVKQSRQNPLAVKPV